MNRASRWIVFLPVAFLALLPQQASAEPEPGLNAIGYLIDEIPPERSDDLYPTCGSEIENNINRNFDGEPFQDCGWDYFMVHYTGFITLPEHETIEFMVAADDGGTVSIAGQEFGTWDLKGCSWSSTITLSVMPGEYELEGWFFEAGGAACYMLAWKIDDAYWEIVPEWAFTTASTPVTTTSTSTVPLETVPVTDPPTTTTLQETSTTQQSTTTTEESTTTSQEPTTTSSPSSSSTTTPSTQPTAPTTTLPPLQEEQPESPPTGTTTTTSSTTPTTSTTSTTEAPTTSTTETSTSTTSSVPPSTVDTTPPATLATPVVVTQPPSTTTEPSKTVPPVSTTAESLPPTTLPETPTTQPAPPTTIRIPTTLAPATTIPPVASTAPLVSATPETVPDTPELVLGAPDASPEQVVKAVDAILETAPSPDQAAQLATNAQVLAVVSTSQAEEIFEALDVSELDNTQIEALIEAVQDAPQEIRETFEETVDIFKTGLDTYVPVGSNIPVGTRRTLVAIGAVLTMLPPPTRIRN